MVDTLEAPPQSLEAETSVIGSALLDPDCLDEVRAILKPEAFYSGRHMLIYRAMCWMRDNHATSPYASSPSLAAITHAP